MNPSLRSNNSSSWQRYRKVLKSTSLLTKLIVFTIIVGFTYVFFFLHYHDDFNNMQDSRSKLIINNNNDKEMQKVEKEDTVSSNNLRNEKEEVIESNKEKNIETSNSIPLLTTSLIIFCYNRPQYLQRTLDSLYSRLGDMKKAFPGGVNMIISQDGSQSDVSNVIEEFKAKLNREQGLVLQHWNHPQKVDFDTDEERRYRGYFALSSHYQWGLTKVFDDVKNERVIILEDDLELGVDFFTFFGSLSKLLDFDFDLYATSSWNDHGVYSSDPKELYRSDFFPGLGWMLCRRIWEELKPKWPRAFWDDWMRDPKQRKNRQIIHPEVPRTITFGEVGASAGQ